MKLTHSVLAVLAGLGLSFAANAQEQATTSSSTGVRRPIAQTDQLFRKQVWRTVDLREKQNQPMFSDGREITRIILDAVKRGELQAYKNDSLTSTMNAKEVAGASSYEEEIGDVPASDDWGAAPAANKPAAAAADPWGSPAPAAAAAGATTRVPVMGANGRQKKDSRGRLMWKNVAAAPAAAPAPKSNLQAYRPKDLFQMDLVEDMIFDKKRSRMYHEIKSITLIVPASKNKKNVDLPIATFKYNDLVKVFRNNPQTAIWFNTQNDAQHKNLADAFELWLFNSYITKVSNPENRSLSDLYGSERNGILAAQQTASDLVEYEYSLWSF